ncbi:MAG: hypothetical protein ABSF65_06595 [Candidatus Bathyarchaeia archaeon]|jgi:hypothetical protein
MVQVAIGYGGTPAEQVATKLRSYLKDEDLEVFLASPHSHDMPQGASDQEQWQLIQKKFLECNIIVYVCHDETPDRSAVKAEMTFIKKHNLFNKMIIFSKSDSCIPQKAKKIWRSMHFAPEKPEESFSRLLNEIFRQHIRLSAPIQAAPAPTGGA